MAVGDHFNHSNQTNQYKTTPLNLKQAGKITLATTRLLIYHIYSFYFFASDININITNSVLLLIIILLSCRFFKETLDGNEIENIHVGVLNSSLHLRNAAKVNRRRSV